MEVPSGNEGLRELLKQAGLTHDAAARALNRVAAEHGEIIRANKSSVSHWLKGVRPHERTIAYLAEALSRRLGRPVHPMEIGFSGKTNDNLSRLPDDPVAALAKLGRADVDRRQMLTSAVYSFGALLLPLGYQRELTSRTEHATAGKAIGWAEVEAVRDITAAFNRADEKLGGGFGRTAVVEYLTTDVAAYCNAALAKPVRSAVFSEAAQLSYLAGWKAHDLGKEGLAQRYYLYSYQLATESGDQCQAAYAMRILAHQAYDMGHVTNCHDLASAALELTKGRVDKHTEAMFLLTLAKAQAMQGESRATLDTISRAEVLMAQSKEDDERPEWAMIHGVGIHQFHNHIAKTLVDIKDYAGVEEHFATSLRHHIDPITKPRIYALSLAWMAEAICQRGHVERACHTWMDALQRMSGIDSARMTEAVTTMRQRLSPFSRRGIPEVKRLLDVSASPS